MCFKLVLIDHWRCEEAGDISKLVELGVPASIPNEMSFSSSDYLLDPVNGRRSSRYKCCFHISKLVSVVF